MDNVGNNELWQAFFTEVSEQLDGLELILADNDAESSADIHQLFRDFHTIKSSCAMMDFHSMEKIAHASEDYLDLVRKNRAPLTKTAIDQLLNGIDWLKSQLQLAKNTGSAPPENISLVDALRTLSAAYSDSRPEDTEDTRGGSQSSESIELALSQDEIDEFASACRQELMVGLAPAAELAKIKRSLNKIVSICNLVGFTAISTLLKKYIRLSNSTDGNRSPAVAAEIIDRISTIERIYSVDCGSSLLRTEYLDAKFIDFSQLSGRLDYLLDLVEKDPDDTKNIENCENLLIELSINSSLFGYSDLLNFFRYVLQTVRSIRRGDIPDKRAAFYAVRQAVDFPIAETIQDGETPLAKSELQTRLSDLNYGISNAIHSGGIEAPKENISRIIEIDSEILDLLMPESVLRLDSMVGSGKRIYEIDIDIDCDQKLMEDLVNCISENGSIIHNRSIFSENNIQDSQFNNFICFIVAFEKNDNPAENYLHAINTDMDSFRCREIRYRNDFDTKADQRKAAPLNNPKDNSAAADSSGHSSAGATLRIETHTLDSLVTQAGEMIMAHNMVGHEISNPEFEKAISIGISLLNKNSAEYLDSADIEKWNYIFDSIFSTHQKIIDNNDRMQKSVNAIQNRILDLRVIPVSAVFNRIPQLVKKMAEAQNKKIHLVTNGKDVRIDKGMVDVLMEPLIHLVRNCIDHGIESPQDRIATGKPEQATLSLSAFQEGSTLVLEISDNGRGINLEKIRESAVRKGFIQPSDNLSDQEICKLIFLPGFSTADVITETSGRGVGMDVVITRINHIGGDIDVQTNPGHGTRFIMTLPLSAAIQSVIMVRANTHQYAIPQSSVIEITSLSQDSICSILGQSAFILRNSAIPLFNLDDLVLENGITSRNDATTFQFPPIAIPRSSIVIVMGQGLQRIGVLVDAIQSREDIFVRELHKDLRSLPAICGVTALGNGELAFILNSNFLLQYAGKGLVAWLNTSQATT